MITIASFIRFLFQQNFFQLLRKSLSPSTSWRLHLWTEACSSFSFCPAGSKCFRLKCVSSVFSRARTAVLIAFLPSLKCFRSSGLLSLLIWIFHIDTLLVILLRKCFYNYWYFVYVYIKTFHFYIFYLIKGNIYKCLTI